MSLSYGMFVIGPSGSGKTTFCNAMDQFFTAIERKHIIINLDPANENMDYEATIDIKELIQIEEVMKELQLGPNGGLIYCFDFLEKNIDWLLTRMKNKKECYMIFDLPGQIELYCNNNSFKNILSTIQNNKILSISMVTVSLFDCLCCFDRFNYISTTILSLISQINLETPHINIFSKVDLLIEYGKLPYRLSMYFDSEVLNLLSDDLEEKGTNLEKKYMSFNKKIVDVVNSSNLISFYPLMINDKLNVSRLVSMIDKANGYYYYIENKKEKFADLRDTVFEFNENENFEFISALEEKMKDLL